MKIIKQTYKFSKTLSKRAGKPTGVVWHNAAASRCTPQDIHRWHLNNGWAGIGYHFVIRKDGKIYQGRPDWAIGSHCLNHNSYIGVCCEGNYDKEEMPSAQYKACVEMQKYLLKKYGKNFDTKGHKEFNPTSCPGKNFPLSKIKAVKLTTSVDKIALKKLMKAYAEKNKIDIPKGFSLNASWGDSAKKLAWRITTKLGIKKSTSASQALYKALS